MDEAWTLTRKAKARNAIMASGWPANERLIAFVLVERAGKEGACWPSIARLAADTGMSQATVKRALPGLLARRGPVVIRREQRTGSQGQDSNLYTLEFVAEGEAQNEPHQGTKAKLNMSLTPGSECASPLAQNEPQIRSGEQDQGIVPSFVAPSRDEPEPAGEAPEPPAAPPLELTPSEPPKPKRGRRKRASKASDDKRSPDPRVTAIRDHWAHAYERTMGEPPKLSGRGWKRSMRAARELLEDHEETELRAMVDHQLADAWMRERGLVHLYDTQRQADRLRSAMLAPKRATKRGYTPQQADASAEERRRVTEAAVAIGGHR